MTDQQPPPIDAVVAGAGPAAAARVDGLPAGAAEELGRIPPCDRRGR